MNKIIFRLLVLQVTFLLYQTAQVYAQDFAYKDSVYVDYIKSVKFNIAGNPLALPAVPLGSEFPLELSFDDMDTHTREYTVSIIHCNKDWTPSQEINELEYLSGFNNAPIRDISISFNTNSYLFALINLHIPVEVRLLLIYPGQFQVCRLYLQILINQPLM